MKEKKATWPRKKREKGQWLLVRRKREKGKEEGGGRNEKEK